MNKEKQEELSTLVDGEHGNNKQVLDRLLIDESMKDKWKRYHMIGDCLRGYLPKKINNSFLESIKKSITAEPKTPFHHKTFHFFLLNKLKLHQTQIQFCYFHDQ